MLPLGIMRTSTRQARQYHVLTNQGPGLPGETPRTAKVGAQNRRKVQATQPDESSAAQRRERIASKKRNVPKKEKR